MRRFKRQTEYVIKKESPRKKSKPWKQGMSSPRSRLILFDYIDQIPLEDKNEV